MKRFHFGLQKVMQLRKYAEEERKLDLGRAVSALNEIESRIAQTAANKSRAAAERFANASFRQDEGSAAISMLHWNDYIVRLDQEAERLTLEAAKAEVVVEEKRADYLEASRDLKVLEKLKEKREKEYRKEMFAAETAELDDIRRTSDG